MNQEQREKILINCLLTESNIKTEVPIDEYSRKRLLRALFNIRLPKSADDEFIRIQNEYLQEEIESKGITQISDLVPIISDIYLWKGDITTLKVDAIVNAANSRMLGCFCPNHGCIDNAIHTFAGIQLRKECNDIMKGKELKTSEVVVTKAYNLPSKYIFHTVGPIVFRKVTDKNKIELTQCYENCLKKADELNISSIAFCCISTGEFGYPKSEAAELAVNTVKEYKMRTNSKIQVVFNVFSEVDYEIYKRLLV